MILAGSERTLFTVPFPGFLPFHYRICMAKPKFYWKPT